MRDILAGVVLIAIGLIRRDSVFLGDFGIFAVIFDALGVFFIVRGLVRMNRARKDGATQPSSPPAPPPAARPR